MAGTNKMGDLKRYRFNLSLDLVLLRVVDDTESHLTPHRTVHGAFGGVLLRFLASHEYIDWDRLEVAASRLIP